MSLSLARAAAVDPSSNVVDRVSAILGAFEDDVRCLGLSELARRAGLPKSTVHRLALDLVETRLLERDGTAFRLGLRLFEIGQRVPDQRTLREVALPYMADLREATHQTINLAVLEGRDVVYVEILRAHDAPAALGAAKSGGRLPAHATGVGKAMLAFLPPAGLDEFLAVPLRRLNKGRTITDPTRLREVLATTRETSIAYDLEESGPGVVCAATPVFGPGDEMMAGLSVSGSRQRMVLEHVASAVRTSALALSRALGAPGRTQ